MKLEALEIGAHYRIRYRVKGDMRATIIGKVLGLDPLHVVTEGRHHWIGLDKVVKVTREKGAQ
jgi:hypothetical protein